MTIDRKLSVVIAIIISLLTVLPLLSWSQSPKEHIGEEECKNIYYGKKLIKKLEKASRIIEKYKSELLKALNNKEEIVLNINTISFLKKNKDWVYLQELLINQTLVGQNAIYYHVNNGKMILYTVKEFSNCVHIICYDPLDLFEIGQSSTSRTLSSQKLGNGWVYRINQRKDDSKIWLYKN